MKIKKYKLKYCCDDVCIFPSRTLLDYENVFNEYYGITAVSTYQLKLSENGEQKKKGKIYFYKLEECKNENFENIEMNYNLKYQKNINFHNGVLQSNFLFAKHDLVLGSVCVNGFYLSGLTDENDKKLILKTPEFKDNSGLSFEAFNNKTNRIIVTFSNGDVCDIIDGNVRKSWKCHDCHVWCVTFNGEENVITTSSDDCSFKVWDLRMDKCILRNIKSHTQGITVVKFDKAENILYTASYDEYIRRFDFRKMNDPLDMINVGSSIWRLKFLYKNEKINKMLVAACDGGAKILKRNDTGFVLTKVLDNNGELTYGIDTIKYINEKKEETKIYLTCSFYNKEIQLWE